MLRHQWRCCSALMLPVAIPATVLCCMRSYDEHAHERFPTGDPSKRAFTYFVLTGGRFIYASALRLAVLKFILSMTVSLIADVRVIDIQGPAGPSPTVHLTALPHPMQH